MINTKKKHKQLSYVDIQAVKVYLQNIDLLCKQLNNETEILNSHIEYLNKHNPSVYFKDILNEGLYVSDVLYNINNHYDNLLKYYQKLL